MKKIKLIFAVLVMGLLVTKECTVAQAAENGLVVESRGLEVRELSQTEINALEEELALEMVNEDASSMMATRSSYRVYEYSEIFEFTMGDTWIAEADARCIVYRYTDGKVHLYSRTITVTRLATWDATRTYGRIVNTDGSLSYTIGDRVGLIGDYDSWDYALDFRVTPTEASFNCYEV